MSRIYHSCTSALLFPSVLDAVGLAIRSGSNLLQDGCWFANGDDLTGALQVL